MAVEQITIVTTMYYSEGFIRPFYERCRAAVWAEGLEVRFVFVNDGSPDNALEVATRLAEEDRAVCVVDLSRNFGHHKAMMVGLAHAKTGHVFLIDIDLEEPPELFGVLWKAYRQPGVDVAFGVQAVRKGPLLHDLAGRFYYGLYNWLSEVPMEQNQLTARVMSQRYVAALLEHREAVFSIETLWAAAGFEQVPVVVEKAPHKGSSTYTFAKKLALVLNAVTGYSSRPLLMIAWLGLVMTLCSLVGVAVVLYQYFVLGWRVDGYTSLIVSIWLVGGLVLFNLGIVSTYLSVIFREIKRRPYVVVRRVIGGDDAFSGKQSNEQID